MKPKLIIALALIIGFATTAHKALDDIIEKLGIRQQQAETAITKNLLGIKPRMADCSGDCDPSNFDLPYQKSALAAIISGDKKTAALELCNYIKTYCESAAFAERYHTERNRNKPNETPKKIDAEYVASLKKTVEETEQGYKNAKTKIEKDSWGGILTSLKENYRKASDPTPQTTEWQEKYPETTRLLIERQLKFYLAELSTVDFNAKLVTKKSVAGAEVKIFADPKYENGKSQTWKYIFRSGKEVNEVVKAFVQNWLNEGIKVAAPSGIEVEKTETQTNKNTALPEKESSTPKAGKKPSLKDQLKKGKDIWNR